MMLDDLKLYTVRVGNGSGCLLQPIIKDCDYTYILTAKHLFENGARDKDDQVIPAIPDGTAISIFRQDYIGDKWKKVPIPFTLTRGVTYFPHKDADAAILKINRLSTGFDRIISIDIPQIITGYFLNGFPNQFGEEEGEEYTLYSIREIEPSGNYSQNAQLANDVLNKGQIEGMSGGGILSAQEGYISIIGIQSRVKHATWANGKICFVPMKYFCEIIDYPEYNDLLTQLHSTKVAIDSANISKSNTVDSQLILFNNYKISCEPFYEERESDKAFINALSTNNIWVHGQSGKGKTAFLHRNLLINKIAFCYCDLSPVLISNYEHILEEMINCIEMQYGLVRDEKECNKIKQVVKLCGKIEGDRFVIVIDELTSLSEELVQAITRAISALVVHYNNSYPDGKLKFVISTLNNPMRSASFPKISQYFEIFNLDNWGGSFTSLFDRINSNINIDVNTFKDKILTNSQESPRLLKNIFRKISLLHEINSENIDIVISRTKNEIV
ncbi:P-loop NTPase family protein [Elizabethkingia miricola]|uniref:hypothetical protein n=1 Tax=Elizabethkingia miricola TaxID=172045 RepID=UPI003892B2EE